MPGFKSPKLVPNRLAPRRRRFVSEYVTDLNGTQAAIRAGYSERTARSQAQRLLTNVDIALAIQLAVAERERRTGIDADWVQARLVEIIERAMQAVAVLDSQGEETGMYTYQGAVANAALAQLAKRTGGFGERGPLDFGHKGNVKAFELRVVYDMDAPIGGS